MSQELFSFASCAVVQVVGERRAGRSAEKRPVFAWAIGETRPMSEREQRLTAAVYAQIPGVLEHLQREGRLPRRTTWGGRERELRALILQRGFDIELSASEELVADAIRAEGDAPEGRVVLLER
jgi:hypothetical protein